MDINQEDYQPQEEEQIENQEQEQANQPEQEGNDLEAVILGSSNEDLDKFDSFEEFVASQNQAEPEQTDSADTQQSETTEQSNAENTAPTAQEVAEMSDAEFRQFITSTFRANHKEVQVTDPQDIRKLMQYGMNFHKKMGELAPHRKILKALESNGLTDESQVNFAIDLLKGKPDAIAQLLKQHEIDTYSLPDLEEQPYQSNDYIPSDLKVNFDETLADIKQSKYGTEIVDYLKDLDESSFHEVYTNPVMLQNLAQHAESGLFADALNVLAMERALGKVPHGIKDIDAYAHIADYLQKNDPAKYNVGVQPQQRVIGNNIQTNTVQQKQHSSAKYQASIPNNQVTKQASSFSGINEFLNAEAKDLAKYDTWEDFLANNPNLQ